MFQEQPSHFHAYISHALVRAILRQRFPAARPLVRPETSPFVYRLGLESWEIFKEASTYGARRA